ncbi:unnamed protein product [Urochloa humidicola]
MMNSTYPMLNLIMLPPVMESALHHHYHETLHMHGIICSSRMFVSNLQMLSTSTILQGNSLLFAKAGQLHLVKPYMVAVQSNNVSAVDDVGKEW